MNRNIFRSPGAGRSLEQQVGNDESKNRRLFNVLTPRQLEVLRLVAEGYSTKQIALKLGISAKTVETHRAQLTERLDIHHVAGLVQRDHAEVLREGGDLRGPGGFVAGPAMDQDDRLRSLAGGAGVDGEGVDTRCREAEREG